MNASLRRRTCLTILLVAMPAGAEARLARCFTTDDGFYDCDFRATDKDGSFEISAMRKPRYSLVLEQPGVAQGFIVVDIDRNIALPGRYRRDKQDLACWTNDETQARICAW